MRYSPQQLTKQKPLNKTDMISINRNLAIGIIITFGLALAYGVWYAMTNGTLSYLSL